MMPFRDYSEYEYRDGLPVVSVVSQPGDSSLYDKHYRDEINGELAELTSVPYQWPLVGLEAIRELLSEYGMTLPDIDLKNEDGSDELVFAVNDHHEVQDDQKPKEADLFLYIFYTPTEDGKIEFHAELANEEELEEILNDLDGDNGSDDSDDDE